MRSPKEIIQMGQLEIRFLLDGDDTGGQMVMFEFCVPPDARVPAPHYHAHVDEILYGLDGALTFTIAGEDIEIVPGERAFVPRGAVHGFVNRGATTARVLAVLTPSSIGPAYFREMAAVLNAGSPPDTARLAEIMQRHGLQAVPPGS